jgi:8-oxo-dGTP diphosphatase
LIRVVVGIIKKDDNLLVAQRPHGKPYSGYWEFPGGKVEANESSECALKRELHEELGISVISAEPWFEYSHAYPDKEVMLAIWLVHAFQGTPWGQEGQVLRWVTPDEMLSLRLLEGNGFILDKIKAL